MKYLTILAGLVLLVACSEESKTSQHFSDAPKIISATSDSALTYKPYIPLNDDIVINRAAYQDKLEGFWLAQCIANWTGLVTEMDKVGNIGEFQTGDFYTREDWGKPDLPNIWSDEPSYLSSTIDFVFMDEDSIWGADDDTDIEYIYQHLLYENSTSKLTGEQIREGWLKHIRMEEENYLWVSNQRALELMDKGIVPPMTSLPDSNKHFDMIDAQLTTEIFGLYAPARPDVALDIAYLPIRTSARNNAALAAEFYVTMYSLTAKADTNLTLKEQTQWMAAQARQILPDASPIAKMHDFVKSMYDAGIPWEQTRDSLYQRYQVAQEDGYDITSQNIYCNGCFAAGINFGASMISLYYGEGDLIETIKIGTLSGWDSDNPTATWGGMLGFMMGKDAVEEKFGRKFSNRFNIHRTRQNFPNDGIDTFEAMAQKGIFIIDRCVQEQMGGGVDLGKDLWYIPSAK